MPDRGIRQCRRKLVVVVQRAHVIQIVHVVQIVVVQIVVQGPRAGRRQRCVADRVTVQQFVVHVASERWHRRYLMMVVMVQRRTGDRR